MHQKKSNITTELIEKIKGYSSSKRIERVIEIGVANSFNQATPMCLLEMELIQAIRSENGEIAEVEQMRILTHKYEQIEDNKQQTQNDKRYEEPFEDDGAYAD